MAKRIKQDLWRFSPINNIETSIFDNNLELFYKLGIKSLTKENIQNSLDARLLNSSLPVIVKINTGMVDFNSIPGINDIITHINSLKGKSTYSKETINNMKEKARQRLISYISFEDINTRGLTGAENGQCPTKNDTWGVYAYNNGVHFEESDEEIETSRGGSHGVGKIASNAASDLHLMFFANCDENGAQHLGGTVQLIEHEYKGQCYRSTGYFAEQRRKSRKDFFYPYENKFHQIFKKKTRGLKIVIPYLREGFDNEDEIIKSVCDGFFISIIDKKLEVHVNEHRINADTISDFVFNPKYYEQDITNMKNDFTPLYVKTYAEEKSINIIVSNGVKEFNFKLYFKYDERIPKGRAAIVRTIGMKIEDFSIRSYKTKPYNAVLIGGLEEDGYLKLLENESHTRISSDHIRDPKLKSQAKKFINRLSAGIAAIIDEEIKRNNPVDGKMDTSDLLYIVENQFKKDLAKAYSPIKIKNGKHIFKASIGDPREKEKKKRKEKPKGTGIKRTRRKNADLKGDETHPFVTYKVNPNIVERIIINDNEFLQFDFKNNSGMESVTSCNLSFSVVDGMGAEYRNEFRFNENYKMILDENTGSELIFDDKSIQNVSINDGEAKLRFDIKPKYNRALKFIYYVEV